MPTRREFLAAAGYSSLTTLHAQQRQRQPNIVFIMADDLGVGDLSCYGQQHFRTPNIDRIAAEGIRFTQAYAGCTVCAPSRSVLMTGLHMGHTSVRSNPGGVPLLPEDVTVAELLKKAGYATGGFGKWGLGDNGTEGAPWRQGFDEFFGYLHQVHAHWYYPEFLYDNGRRFPLKGNENGKRTTYSHDVIADRALDFIRRHKDEPFFCYVPFTLPHWELLVPEDSLNQYKGKFPEWAFVDKRKHYADQPNGRAAYAAMVTRMDRDVGRILKLLEELKLADDTVIFFASDNGAALPIRSEDFFRSTLGLRGHKQNLYEGGIRVPMVARWPGRIPKGTTNDMPWAFWDVLPTFCDIAGIEAPKNIDGRSVLPALTGKQQPAQPFLYWELPRYDAKTGKFRDEVPMQAGRMGDWKVVRPEPNAPLELYNLASDPYEKKNVAGEHQQIVQKMEQLLKSSRVPPRPQPHPPMDWQKT
jgi:arylsulfatase A-like enzyme